MKPFFRALLVGLSVLVGAVFVFSAYSKAFPIYGFEATLVEFAGLPYTLAAIAARAFTGLEAAMGLLLVLNMYGARKWVLWGTVGLLMAFNVYLVYLWVRFGSGVNCGCFGDALWMNAPVSLLKNAGLLAALLVLAKWHTGIAGRWTLVPCLSAPLSLLIVPFIIFPMNDLGPTPDMNPWYAGKGVSAVPPVELRKGKHVVAFLSPSCSHCRKAAKRMHEIHLQYPGTSFFLVIGGMESKLDDFWKDSKAEDLPHIRMEKEAFLKATGGVFPRILWVKDGVVVSQTGYSDLKADGVWNWERN